MQVLTGGKERLIVTSPRAWELYLWPNRLDSDTDGYSPDERNKRIFRV